MTTTVENCLFCKIVAGEIPAQLVFQDDEVTAFYDVNPQAPVHVLIIANTHTPNHLETDDPTIYAQVLAGSKKVAQQLKLTDYRLVINNGAGAGQSVFHLHVHLMAGRPFGWPAG
jgi:histidine triad (HIT) family protein